MKKPQWIYRNLSLILSLVLLLSLVCCTLADSNCYNDLPSGKKIILNVQKIKGYDCFTGKFIPPKVLPANYGPGPDQELGIFNFERFRALYLSLIGLVSLNALFLLFRKRIFAAIFLSLGFLAAIVSLIYFDGYHNYYFDSADERFGGKGSLTVDINFGWLSSIYFWLLFVVMLFLNWVTLFAPKKKKWNPNLLDN